VGVLLDTLPGTTKLSATGNGQFEKCMSSVDNFLIYAWTALTVAMMLKLCKTFPSFIKKLTFHLAGESNQKLLSILLSMSSSTIQVM